MARISKSRPNAPKGAAGRGKKKGAVAKRAVKKHVPVRKAAKVARKVDAATQSVSAGLGLATSPREMKARVPKVVKVHYAKTNLSKLLQRVRRGGRVQIAVGNQAPSFELVTINAEVPKRGFPRQFGSLRGVVTVDERFFEPLPAEELDAWER